MSSLDRRLAILDKHLEEEHYQTPFADYFKEVIYGGIDGIVTTFAVVAGFSGAAISSDATTQLSFMVVLLFGLANLFADGVSMGLGNFLAVRSDQDLYKQSYKKEKNEIRNNAEYEYQETITILMKKGFSEADATAMADLYRKNEEYWITFMMNHELEMPDVRGENPVFTGLATFLSFMVFGAIPLLPFILETDGDPATTFVYSSIGTFIALVLLGILKWRVIGERLTASLTEVILVGGTAAILAYFVGTFFAA